MMGGTVLLQILTKYNGFDNGINDELIVCKIHLDVDFIEQSGENADVKKVSINDRKPYLKMHETRRLMQNNQLVSKEDALKKTNSIEPFSDSMRRILEKKSKILASSKT